MQHREIITTKLEQVEGKLARLEFLLSKGSREDFYSILVQTRDLVDDIKSYVQREPRTPGEFSYTQQR